jgi:hypothetical protein
MKEKSQHSEEIVSLNIEDLDVEELERRFEMAAACSAPACPPKACPCREYVPCPLLEACTRVEYPD